MAFEEVALPTLKFSIHQYQNFKIYNCYKLDISDNRLYSGKKGPSINCCFELKTVELRQMQ